MKIAKWGNSLAVRIPVDVAEALALRVGSEVDMLSLGSTSLMLNKRLTPEQVQANLDRLRFSLPADWKFDREEANAR